MQNFIHTLLLSILLVCFSSITLSSPEKFGQRPAITALTISPSGSHYAWLQNYDNKQLVVVFDIKAGKPIRALKIDKETKGRGLIFATDNYLVIQASETLDIGFRDRQYEFSEAFSYNIEKNKLIPLFKRSDEIHQAQSGVGKVLGIKQDKLQLIMPAYEERTVLERRNPAPYNLYRVSLKTGKAKLYKRGKSDTKDWFVGHNGKVLAREDFDDEKNVHALYSYLEDHIGKQVFGYDTEVAEVSISAISNDEKGVLFIKDGDQHQELFELSLVDGVISEPKPNSNNLDIARLVTNKHRIYQATKFSGFVPSYTFENETLGRAVDSFLAKFPNSSVDYIDSSKDFKLSIFYVSGNDQLPSYYLYDTANLKITKITTTIDGLKNSELGNSSAFYFNARDNLKIPSILTWPKGFDHESNLKPNLPLIVLPPYSRPEPLTLRYHWLTQFLANKGYAVFSPNIRGTYNFGWELYVKGLGEIGKKQLLDVDDGVNYLVDKGIADSSRICILGELFGGHTALMSAINSPNTYRCVIGINAVTDLESYVFDRSTYRTTDINKAFWEQEYGKFSDVKETYKDLSPITHSEEYTAPILSIVSEKNDILRIDDAEKFQKQLEKLEKSSELVILDDEDRFISSSKNRIKTLTAIGEFLDTHNPVQPQ